MLVPVSFEDLQKRIENFEDLSQEEMAFLFGALIYLASRSARLLEARKKDTEKFSLFMKFASCVDPNLNPRKTFKNFSGQFLNYAMGKLKSNTESKKIPCLSRKALETLGRILNEALSSEGDLARRTQIGMMWVRDASYVYVFFGRELEDLFLGAKRGFGCMEEGD